MTICSIEGCEKAAARRGWCNGHYQRWRRHGDPLLSKRVRNVCRIDGCEKLVTSRGLCLRHYTRLRRWGDPLALKQEQRHGLTLAERWHSNVAKSRGCWEWRGYCDPRGYGRLMVRGRPVLAHRVAWALFFSEPSPEQHVCHRCDNPSCVRPEHLFLGDHAANMADKIAKKRHRYGVSRGAAHGCSKLTDADVLAIRESVGPSRIIAEQYGISGRQVRDIRARKAWRHLP